MRRLLYDYLKMNPEAAGLFGRGDGRLCSVNFLACALYGKDPATYYHSENVADLSLKIAGSLALDKKERRDVFLCAYLHDIGKIGIEDVILKKESGLTDAEFISMKRHPVIGEQILRQIKGFDRIGAAVRHHHEKYDGSGYPDGLSRGQIPFEARIISVADSFDAMLARPYSKIKSKSEALSEIRRNISTQFDMEIAGEFIGII